MIDKFRLFSLTALVVTAGATSAQAHAVDGVGAGSCTSSQTWIICLFW